MTTILSHPFFSSFLYAIRTFPAGEPINRTRKYNNVVVAANVARVDILVARSRTGIEKEKERKKGKKNKRDEERSSTKREPFRFTLPNAIPLALFPTFLSPRGGSGIKRGLGKTEDSARSVYIDSSSRNRDSW